MGVPWKAGGCLLAFYQHVYQDFISMFISILSGFSRIYHFFQDLSAFTSLGLFKLYLSGSRNHLLGCFCLFFSNSKWLCSKSKLVWMLFITCLDFFYFFPSDFSANLLIFEGFVTNVGPVSPRHFQIPGWAHLAPWGWGCGSAPLRCGCRAQLLYQKISKHIWIFYQKYIKKHSKTSEWKNNWWC